MIQLIQNPRRKIELPKCPWPIQEEVEKFAREHDRTAKVYFAPGGGWFARFSLKPNDPRMLLYKEGKADRPPSEDVWFHRQKRGGRSIDFEPLDIEQMGPLGVRTFLERGNTFSGRGEYTSLEDQLKKVQEANKKFEESHRAHHKEANRDDMKRRRRKFLGIPFLPVGIDLGRKTKQGRKKV